MTTATALRRAARSATRRHRARAISSALRGLVEPLENRLLLSTTLANNPFESNDGNLVVDGGAGSFDWSNAPHFSSTLDKPTGSTDDSFTGTSENNVGTGANEISTGSIPNNKSDLLRFYISYDTVTVAGNDNYFLYLAWERASNDTTGPNGSANMDFEFNQSRTPSINGVTPVRSVGDLLITYDFTNGGSTGSIGYATWQGTQWSAITDLTLSGFAEGAINGTGSVVDPINPGAPRTLAPNTFGECAINLTAAGIFSSNQLVNYGSVYLKSRSSAAFNSELKDLIAPQQVIITNGVVYTGHKFNDSNGNGLWDTGEQPIQNWTINIDEVGGAGFHNSMQTLADGSYSFLVPPGTYTVTEGSQTGWTETTANPGPVTLSTRGSFSNWDFGNFQSYSVSGLKLLDADGSLATTNDQTPQANVWIQLYRDNGDNTFDPMTDTFVSQVKTGATGAYNFTGLGLGTYYVDEIVPIGYQQLSPGSPDYYTLNVANGGTSGATLTGFNFVNTPSLNITGTKFIDDDGSASTTNDRTPYLGGVTIQLYTDLSASPIATTVTSATDGTYAFSHLAPGTYYVKEVVPTGYVQIVPSTYYTVTLTGTSAGNINFANFQKVTVDGYKFNDKDGDGTWDAGEPGINNWTIYLTQGGTTTSTTTDVNGHFVFNGVGPGAYTLTEDTSDANWTCTYGVGGYNFSTHSGQNVSKNFGNFKDYSVSGAKILDQDGNLATTNDQSPMVVWIDLYQDNGDGVLNTGTDSLVTRVQTNATTGAYTIGGIGLGKYFLAEEVPTGYRQISPLAPAYYTLNNLDGNSGAALTGDNFYNAPNLDITGTKFIDDDGLASTTNDETPYTGGVTIQLYTNPNGSPIATTTTSLTDGTYAFHNLVPGTYYVKEVVPAGFVQIVPASYYTLTLTSADANNIDFANFQTVSVSGYKFNDVNGDGTWQTATEPGKAGWTIYLTQGGTTISTTTDANGYFVFNGVGPGSYSLTEDTSDPNWMCTYGIGGYTFSTHSGQNVAQNFGNFEYDDVEGYKFNDLNGDGTWQTATEPGISGWTIYLTQGGTTISTTTDVNGHYSFGDVGPGTVTLTEENRSGWLPTLGKNGYTFTSISGLTDTYNFGNFQTPTIDAYKFNDLNGNGKWDTGEPGITDWNLTMTDGTNTWTATTDGTGHAVFGEYGPGTYTITEESRAGWTPTMGVGGYTFQLVSGATDTYTFGNFQDYSISGTKFNDLNGNGVWDTGEGTIAGVKITLDGVVKATTGPDGTYTITGIGPGSHTVGEICPAGWTQTTANYTVNGTSGAALTGYDIGNFLNVTVEGQKFQDANFNAVFDLTDPRLNGWTVQAFNSQGQLVATGVTADVDLDGNGTIDPLTERGVYMLSLGAGTYTIKEQQRSDWVQFYPISKTYTITVGGDTGAQSGSTLTGYDFGNAPLIAHGAHTLGFWSNKNGQDVLKGTDNFASSLAFLDSLPLKNADGSDFDPTNYQQLRNWLLKGKATNMAYMLSVQTATLALNDYTNIVHDTTLVYAPSLLPYASQIPGLSPLGVISVHDLLAASYQTLSANPLTISDSIARDLQGALENVIDACNNDMNYLT